MYGGCFSVECGDFFGRDTAFELRIAKFVTARIIRKSDGKIVSSDDLVMDFLAKGFGGLNVYFRLCKNAISFGFSSGLMAVIDNVFVVLLLTKFSR